MLGGGLEPPCLSAYAPQTYVSAISPPERVVKMNQERKIATATALRNPILLALVLVLLLVLDFSERGAEPALRVRR